MIDPFFRRLTVRRRIASGPVGPHLAALARVLQEQGYAHSTIRQCLHASGKFGRWLTERQMPLTEVNEVTITHYVRELGRSPSGQCPKTAKGLGHLVLCLQQQGLVPAVSTYSP